MEGGRRFSIPKTGLILLALSAVLALLTAVLWYLSPEPIKLVSYGWEKLGGGGGIAYYDRLGQRQDVHFKRNNLSGDTSPQTDLNGQPTYVGDAPLYTSSGNEIDPYMLAPLVFPENIPPEVVREWQPVYPLILSAELDKPMVQSGSDTILRVTAAVSDHFTGNYQEAPLWISPGERVNGDLVLEAPNFEFKQENKPIHLMVGETIQEEWVVAPKERAQGEQKLIVDLQSPNVTVGAAYFLATEVQPRPPVGLTITEKVTMAGAIVTLISGVVAIAIKLLDFRANGSKNKKRSKYK